MGYYLCVVLVLAITATDQVLGFPLGAPSTACAAIMPQHTATANTATGDVPFSVNISSLDGGYMPGQTYTIVLSGGSANPNFRGFLIQGRLMADRTTPAGTFVVNGATDQQASCSGSAATHVARTEKTMVQLTWTAPATGTGPVLFRYAFVDNYQPTVPTSMFWAGLETSAVSEVAVMSTTSVTPNNMTTMTTSVAPTMTTSVAPTMTTSVAPATTTVSVSVSPTQTGRGGGGATGLLASSLLILLLTSIISFIN